MGRRTAAVRAVAAHVVWVASAAVAVCLAVAALLVGLRVDEESVFGTPVRWAGWLDLPRVGRGQDVLSDVVGDAVHQTVIAWGGAALVWLVVGLVVTLALRPVRVTPTPGG